MLFRKTVCVCAILSIKKKKKKESAGIFKSCNRIIIGISYMKHATLFKFLR